MVNINFNNSNKSNELIETKANQAFLEGKRQQEAGNLGAAVSFFLQAVLLVDKPEYKKSFANSLCYAEFKVFDPRLEDLLLSLLLDTSLDPQPMAFACASLAKLNPAPLMDNRLLQQLMRTVIIPDREIEKQLTEIRENFLLTPELINKHPAFAEALAKQCQLTEGIYAISPGEAALLQNNALPPLLKECYEPQPPKIPPAIIPAFGRIENEVSGRVAEQYENFPYPLWEYLPAVPENIYPKSFRRILVAGCGTGRHALMVANSFPEATVTAVDLSLHSLEYAKHKAQALGITNIAFFQGDLLQIQVLEETYDLIECTGVLHHMEHPLEGWRALKNCLSDDGWMHIGLYSRKGRHDVAAARHYINVEKFSSSREGIRSARQFLRALPSNDPAKIVCHSVDFYSFAGCHDYLFNVQEHTFDLPEIQRMLNELNLTFDRFTGLAPGLPQFESLEEADAFEKANPMAFFNMYQFWVKREA